MPITWKLRYRWHTAPQPRNATLRPPPNPKIFLCLHARWSAEVILKADVGSINGLRNREHSPGDATILQCRYDVEIVRPAPSVTTSCDYRPAQGQGRLHRHFCTCSFTGI